MPECKIIVATHKPYWMPSDPCYFPLQVGSAGKSSFGIARDDYGDSISSKNIWYCELTGIYWAWKNLRADYIGLVHYRRYFSKQVNLVQGKKAILNSNDWLEMLKQHPLILPARRNYFIACRRNQFLKAHGALAVDCLENVLRKLHPRYFVDYEASLAKTWGHIFNMFVMRRDIFDAYCSWLFPFLGHIEEEIRKCRGAIPPRLLGFIAERLLDVWIEHNRLPYKELNYVNLETINWPAKIFAFIKRTFAPTKPE